VGKVSHALATETELAKIKAVINVRILNILSSKIIIDYSQQNTLEKRVYALEL
jgi:hypothetical protein